MIEVPESAAAAAPEPSAKPGKARSVAQAAISQGLSAGSNFVIPLALGRGADEGVIGEFALAFIVYNAALGLQRALVTDALLARPFRGPISLLNEDARAVTTSLLLSVTAAVVVLIAGLTSPYHQLVVLAAVLPALLLEDICRYLLFRRQRPAAAAIVDGVWALTSFVGFFYLVHHATSRTAIVVWGLGGLLATITGLVVARLSLAPIRASLRWWRAELWRSSRWLTLESSLFHADQQLTAFGFVAMAGKGLFGDWQVTQSLLGIAAFLNVGLIVMSVTHMSREVGDRRTALVASVTSLTFVILLTGALVLAKSELLRILYRDHVHISTATILASGVFLAMGSAATGPIALLRAQRTEKVLPLARGVALVLFSPLAVIVARHNFTAALWILAGGAATYLAIVAGAAARRPDAHHEALLLAEVSRELEP